MTATNATLATRMRRGRATRGALAFVTVAGVLFLFVFPTQALLAQRRDVRATRHDVEVLRQENARLEREAALLQTESEIERIARAQYHMVRPGEQAYAVVPAPEPEAGATSDAADPPPSGGSAVSEGP